MWRFIKGVEEPTPKKRQSTDERNEYFKDYDKKRKWMCNPKWETKYDWLCDDICKMLIMDSLIMNCFKLK